MHFDCCQALIAGIPWGSGKIKYQAAGVSARAVLEDLMEQTGGKQSYNLRCQPLDTRWCFISVQRVRDRRKAPEGVCAALGYDGE